MKPTEPLLNMSEELRKAGEMYMSRGLANVDAILKVEREAVSLSLPISEPQINEVRLTLGSR